MYLRVYVCTNTCTEGYASMYVCDIYFVFEPDVQADDAETPGNAPHNDTRRPASRTKRRLWKTPEERAGKGRGKPAGKTA